MSKMPTTTIKVIVKIPSKTKQIEAPAKIEPESKDKVDDKEDDSSEEKDEKQDEDDEDDDDSLDVASDATLMGVQTELLDLSHRSILERAKVTPADKKPPEPGGARYLDRAQLAQPKVVLSKEKKKKTTQTGKHKNKDIRQKDFKLLKDKEKDKIIEIVKEKDDERKFKEREEERRKKDKENEKRFREREEERKNRDKEEERKYRERREERRLKEEKDKERLKKSRKSSRKKKKSKKEKRKSDDEKDK